DGIRDRTVTGVQTCALPISAMTLNNTLAVAGLLVAGMVLRDLLPTLPDPYVSNDPILERQTLSAGLLAEIGWPNPSAVGIGFTQIGRASCRERRSRSVGRYV